MRLFLGIDLPEQTKKTLYETLLPLRRKHPNFRWVDPTNYHITLQFFGEVNNPEEVVKRVKDVLYDSEQFYLSSLHLDTFVNRQIDLYLDFRRQKKLERVVELVKADLGVDDKLTLIPHVTLSKSPLSSKQQYFALRNEIDKLPIEIEFNVDTLYMFESIITHKSPIYNKMAEFKLLRTD